VLLWEPNLVIAQFAETGKALTMADKQMCLGCGTRPATNSNGTVPLCAQCAAQAAGKERGVEYTSQDEPVPDTLRNA